MAPFHQTVDPDRVIPDMRPDYSKFSRGLLNYAIEAGNIDGVKELINAEPDFLTLHDDESCRFEPPVILAAGAGHDEILRLLLQQRAALPPESRNPRYWDGGCTCVCNNYGTILTAACASGRLSTVQLVLDLEPQIDFEDGGRDGRTPLIAAGSYITPWSEDREQIIRLLLDRGSKASAIESYVTNNEETLLRTTLTAPMVAGGPRVVEWLLKAGADPNIAVGHWVHFSGGTTSCVTMTPLQIGSLHHNAAAVETLLDYVKISGLTDADATGMLPLHFAAWGYCEHKRVDSAEYKLDPLAGARETKQTIQLLLNDAATRNTTINSQDIKGWTPLHHAANVARIPALQALLENGADPLILNSNCQMPLHLLLSSVQYRSRSRGFELGLYAFDEPESLVLQLLGIPNGYSSLTGKNTAIHHADFEGNTLLHIASALWLGRTIALLLRLGANPELLNKAGQTPRHLAATSSTYDLKEGDIGVLERNLGLQDRIMRLLGHSDRLDAAGKTSIELLESNRLKRQEELTQQRRILSMEAARHREIARIKLLPPEEQWPQWRASKWHNIGMPWGPRVPDPSPGIRSFGRGINIPMEKAYLAWKVDERGRL